MYVISLVNVLLCYQLFSHVWLLALNAMNTAASSKTQFRGNDSVALLIDPEETTVILDYTFSRTDIM